MKLTSKQSAIEWRRSRVLELSSEGHSQREIASKLQIAKGTVTNDLLFLRKQAQQNLQHHITEVVPEEYQKCMVGMKRNLKRVLEIGEASSDPKIKLEALKIANDSHRFIMELATNGAVVSNAMNFVVRQQEQIQKMETVKLLDKRIEAIEQEKSTDGVF